jgi:cytochrome c-type biogenesis protein CcmH
MTLGVQNKKSFIDGRFQAKMPGGDRGNRGFIFCMIGLLFAGAVLLSRPAQAQLQTPTQPLPSEALAQRLKTLESELRCLVCQNQTLAESPAGLAGDLRREVRSLVEQGKSDAEVKAFLRARYGDFVLYKPPLDTKTYLLWYGPFGLLLIAAVSAILVIKKRAASRPSGAVPGVVGDAQDRARRLLGAEDDRG